MWKLQICQENENEYHNYIVQTPKQIYKDNKLIGNSIHEQYYGSTTRINEIGTIYHEKTFEKYKIKLRLLDENDTVLFDYQLTDYDINKLAKLDVSDNQLMQISNSHKIGNIHIYCRDLHRWKNHPYEISGITIYI